MKISDILKFINAELADVDVKFKDIDIVAINSLKNSNIGDISYCDSDKNSKFLPECKASAVLIKDTWIDLVPKNCYKIISKNPHLDFAILSKIFAKNLISEKNVKNSPIIGENCQIMQNVSIGVNVKIGRGCIIMPGVFIGDNVLIGDNCILHPNCVIFNDCVIGNGCHLLSCCVIGSDGFGYAHNENGEHIKIYHNGNVVLEDFVEVGACTTIDRGVFDSTIIKKGSKIDNLVQIGHNCIVGENSILVSQVGLAGSTTLGKNVVMGGQSGSGGHVSIGDFTQVAARGGVSKNLPAFKQYAGYPIMELKDWFKLNAKINNFFKNK